jgi:hypothetical protein
MRYQAALSFALILLASPPHLAHSAPATKAVTTSKATATKVDVRQFSFPTDFPIGALKMTGCERLGTDNVSHGIGPAQGSKMSYLAMEDLDHSICDKALHTLPEFKDLTALHIDRSDTTDKGLAGFKSVPSVKYLYASGADLDGSIFKESQKLKSVENLNLIFNPLKSENLKYLSALPHLTELVLNQSNHSDSDFSNLAKCTQIKRLYLLSNPKITDKSLPVLQGLTGLQVLDIRGTGITFEGLLTLKNLKLERLNINVRRYRPKEIEQLTKAFPKAYLDYRGVGVGVDNQIYFAPLK